MEETMTDRDALARDEDQTITITVRRWREHIANARAEALEEAAAVAEYHGDWAIAQEITTLKDAKS
jgi:hypothetical protein